MSVTWTAAAPDDPAGGPARRGRQHRLRRLLAEAHGQAGAPGVRDLAELRAAGERPRTRRGRGEGGGQGG